MKDKQIIPRHLAIIMDGNRRWAKEHNLSAIAGHQKVANEVLEPLVEHAAKIGIEYLTFWAFSTENWRRTPAEVSGIMNIFRNSIISFGRKMHEKGIKIKMIGDLTKFDPDIQKSVNDLIELTKNNNRITVVFALNYGGRDEIIRAIKRLSKDQNINNMSDNLIFDQFSKYLDTAGIPDPEMIVRTGGEQRLSGFLLWQSEYSELYFPVWYMPEFSPDRLDEILLEYTNRQRRFGR
jgi:undecaprenyl diphosphate synthase